MKKYFWKGERERERENKPHKNAGLCRGMKEISLQPHISA